MISTLGFDLLVPLCQKPYIEVEFNVRVLSVIYAYDQQNLSDGKPIGTFKVMKTFHQNQPLVVKGNFISRVRSWVSGVLPRWPGRVSGYCQYYLIYDEHKGNISFQKNFYELRHATGRP